MYYTIYQYFVFTLTDSAGNPHQYCLACYRIPDGFEPTIVSHGNSKTRRPFYPTLPSTMEQVRRNVQSIGPKETLAIVSAAAGGITGACRPGELPRDEKQVSNIRQSLTAAKRMSALPGDPVDVLFVLMQQAKLGDSRGLFIHELKAAPEPAIKWLEIINSRTW